MIAASIWSSHPSCAIDSDSSSTCGICMIQWGREMALASWILQWMPSTFPYILLKSSVYNFYAPDSLCKFNMFVRCSPLAFHYTIAYYKKYLRPAGWIKGGETTQWVTCWLDRRFPLRSGCELLERRPETLTKIFSCSWLSKPVINVCVRHGTSARRLGLRPILQRRLEVASSKRWFTCDAL